MGAVFKGRTIPLCLERQTAFVTSEDHYAASDHRRIRTYHRLEMFMACCTESGSDQHGSVVFPRLLVTLVSVRWRVAGEKHARILRYIALLTGFSTELDAMGSSALGGG